MFLQRPWVACGVLLGGLLLGFSFANAQTVSDQDDVSITARVAPENTIIFSGDACPSCQVFLLLGGTIRDSSTSFGDGSFQLSIEGIDAGTHQFTVYAVDLNGIQSGSSSFSVSISQGVIVYVSGILVPPTLRTSSNSYRIGETATLSGYTVPNGDVTIDVDSGALFINVTSASDGEFYYQLDTSNFQIGTHSATAFVDTGVDVSGNSRLVEFEIVEEAQEEDDEDDEDDNEDGGDICKDADYNGNNSVNIVDFSILIFWYGKDSLPGKIDLNNDNKIDLTDFSILVYCWTG